MRRADRAPPGLDLFWEEADAQASGEHPLERELAFRLDALERYRAMIVEAQADGRDEIVHALSHQHARQAQFVHDLRVALRRQT
ncbi:MAG: hypothetical protein ACRENP_23940 [Longimicrobiales bacterium]